LEGTREISRSQGSELSSATIVPQDGVVADITHSKDLVYLMPGNAVGTATPEKASQWATGAQNKLEGWVNNSGVLPDLESGRNSSKLAA